MGKTTAASVETASDEAVVNSSLPLFFIRPQPVDRNRHQDASVFDATYAFAKNTNSIPVNVVEWVDAMKHYPIVFTMGENPMPVAVVGLEEDNYFVNEQGGWEKNAYIPTYARQYPFVFYEEKQGQCVLCVDEGAPHFCADGSQGFKLFADGEPDVLAQQALQFCSSFYEHALVTRALMADLEKYKLLSLRESDVTLADGHKIHMAGFQVIDEVAFNALSDEIFLEFRQQGWLPFIALALASTSCWKNLVDRAFELRSGVK